MEAEIPAVPAQAEPAPPPKGGRSRAKRNRDAKKTEEFRQRKGDAFVAAEKQRIMNHEGTV